MSLKNFNKSFREVTEYIDNHKNEDFSYDEFEISDESEGENGKVDLMKNLMQSSGSDSEFESKSDNEKNSFCRNETLDFNRIKNYEAPSLLKRQNQQTPLPQTKISQKTRKNSKNMPKIQKNRQTQEKNAKNSTKKSKILSPDIQNIKKRVLWRGKKLGEKLAEISPLLPLKSYKEKQLKNHSGQEKIKRNIFYHNFEENIALFESKNAKNAFEADFDGNFEADLVEDSAENLMENSNLNDFEKKTTKSQKNIKNKTSKKALKKLNRASNKALNKNPNKALNKIPNKIPNKALNKISNKALNKIPNKALNKISKKALNKISNKALNKISNKALNKADLKIKRGNLMPNIKSKRPKRNRNPSTGLIYGHNFEGKICSAIEIQKYTFKTNDNKAKHIIDIAQTKAQIKASKKDYIKEHLKKSFVKKKEKENQAINRAFEESYEKSFSEFSIENNKNFSEIESSSFENKPAEKALNKELMKKSLPIKKKTVTKKRRKRKILTFQSYQLKKKTRACNKNKALKQRNQENIKALKSQNKAFNNQNKAKNILNIKASNPQNKAKNKKNIKASTQQNKSDNKANFKASKNKNKAFKKALEEKDESFSENSIEYINLLSDANDSASYNVLNKSPQPKNKSLASKNKLKNKDIDKVLNKKTPTKKRKKRKLLTYQSYLNHRKPKKNKIKTPKKNSRNPKNSPFLKGKKVRIVKKNSIKNAAKQSIKNEQKNEEKKNENTSKNAKNKIQKMTKSKKTEIEKVIQSDIFSDYSNNDFEIDSNQNSKFDKIGKNHKNSILNSSPSLKKKIIDFYPIEEFFSRRIYFKGKHQNFVDIGHFFNDEAGKVKLDCGLLSIHPNCEIPLKKKDRETGFFVYRAKESSLKLITEDDEQCLMEGDFINIPPNKIFSMKNTSEKSLAILFFIRGK